MLTEGRSVRPVCWKPEDDEGEEGEEHTGQRQDVAREHHLSPHLEREGEHDVERQRVHRATRSALHDVPGTRIFVVRLKRPQVDAFLRLAHGEVHLQHVVRPGAEEQVALLRVEREVLHVNGTGTSEYLMRVPEHEPSAGDDGLDLPLRVVRLGSARKDERKLHIISVCGWSFEGKTHIKVTRNLIFS